MFCTFIQMFDDIAEPRHINIEYVVAGGTIKADELVRSLKKDGDPPLLSAGGSTRVLLSIPERSQSEILPREIQTQFEQTPTVVPGTTGDVVTCCEVECVPLDNVSLSLLQDRPDSIDFASRLHARTDIEWCPLNSIRL